MNRSRYGLAGRLVAICVALAALVAAPASSQETLSPGAYEIRWFFTGDIPDAVERWFATWKHDGQHARTEQRQDLYLVSGDSDGLSPKFREGRLEIKLRALSLETSLCTGIAGVIEQWTKSRWNYDADSDAIVRSAFSVNGLEGARRTVTKHRRQIKFVFNKMDVQQVPAGTRVSAGAVLEITRLDNGSAWTLAFDVFVDDDLSRDGVAGALCELLKGYQGPTLSEANSMGYAAWLGSQ